MNIVLRVAALSICHYTTRDTRLQESLHIYTYTYIYREREIDTLALNELNGTGKVSPGD